MSISQAELLAALSESGFNRHKASLLLGVHPSTLFRAMRKYRISVPDNRRRVSPSDIPLMTGLRQSGLSFQKIGEKFGVTGHAARSLITRRGFD